ncbi:MAG: arginine--tRNA ligase [Magnetovibrio sp.]|nr:arginine--tRNA ligase [Magnetovibrio sp.]
MNIHQTFRQHVLAAIDGLAAAGRLPADMDLARVGVEPPREAGHGDLSTNAAMLLAKPAKMKPRDIAEMLVEPLRALDAVADASVAGPGFINLTLAPGVWHECLAAILEAGTAYGNSDMGGGAPVNVEYVSANPTGPLHVAHARGAVTGDALANLLAKAGYAVTTEYYINDAGAQVDALARSAHLRYREALGDEIGEIPEGLYPGDYMVPVGEALAAEGGDAWRDAPEAEWLERFRDRAIEMMMETVRADLAALGVEQKVFTSERGLVDAGAVDAVFEILEGRGLIYTGVLEPPKGKKPDDWEPRPQTLFKATDFGDDVDRPMKKSDGSWTYFANDIAYHYDKYQRGFTTMIDIFGADHGGYVKRMKAAVAAMSDGGADLDIKLCQMVHLKKGGEPMRMSKRAGNFVTLRDLIDEVGKDVVRFIMLTRKNDSQMEFDLDKVVEQTRDNPVFYVQYAHARCRSVLRAAAELFGGPVSAADLAGADLAALDDPSELELIKRMAEWPRAVEAAAEAHEPHRVAYYLHDLAESFHALWNKGKDDVRLRFIHEDDDGLTRARLALVQGVALVIASGLEVFGVTPVEELR